ncbi:MAG: hypothetical protein ACSHX7_10145 [Luteolibacter sp.]
MKSRILLSLPILGSLFFVSCYPIPDGPRKPRGAEPAKKDQTISSPDQQEIQKKREAMKKQEAAKKKQVENIKKTPPKNDNTTSKPPAEKKSNDYKFANPVPGKEGFVFSPYNNKLVDVRDIPSGTLVQDPTYPASEKKYFRVP